MAMICFNAPRQAKIGALILCWGAGRRQFLTAKSEGPGLWPGPASLGYSFALLPPGWPLGRRRRSRFGIGHRLLRLFGHRRQPQRLADFGLQLLADIRVVLEELLGVFAALANAVALVAEPRTRLLHQVHVHRQVDEVAFMRDAFPVYDVELGLAEGRGGLVLHDLDLGAIADNLIALFDGADAANVDAHRGVELQRAPARGGFRIAEHHANLLANLVDEDKGSTRLGNDAGKFAQGLRHQAGLQTDMAVPHPPVEF